jgi:glycosyltransferase involved in cell wall biosynthesis
VATLLRAIKPDLVDGNWISRSSGLYCAASGYHPFLATAWGTDILIEPKHSRLLRIFASFTLRVADAVIVDSEIQRKAVLDLGCSASKICCFPWGIDLHKFRPEKGSSALRENFGWQNSKLVVSTRMHYPRYDVKTLIESVPIVLSKVNSARFIIAGDGELLGYHKSLANELGVDYAIQFMGLVPNDQLPELLCSADVYVSTSISDGTSASLIEAMSCGLPVVVTKIPGNEEWVDHGKNGLLFPPRDSRALAEDIVSILRNENLRSMMREENLKLTKKRADWEKNSQIFLRCVEDLLRDKTR